MSIPEKKCTDLLSLTRSFLDGPPVAPMKELRSYAGKASFVAGLISTIKPFLSSLWAVVASLNASAGPSRRLRRVARLPPNLTHIRRCAHSLSWLLPFFTDRRQGLTRKFWLSIPPTTVNLRVAVDTSPWDSGASSWPTGFHLGGSPTESLTTT